MTTDGFWARFRRWRRHRPFWGGLFLLLSAGELFFSANMSLGGMQIHLGPQGFLSYLLPVILLICGLLTWFTPAQRLFYGIVALLAALYSFIGLNLGGFGIGMLLGIVGGGLVIAWGPPRIRPDVTDEGEPPTGEPGDHGNDLPADFPEDQEDEQDAHEDDTERIEIAGHDDRPHEPVRRATQDPGTIVPGFPQQSTPGGMQRLARSPRAVLTALIPVAATATVLVAGSSLPASAQECPEGLPSRSATAASPSATKAESAAAKADSAAAKKATSAKRTTAATTAASDPATSAPATAEKPAEEKDDGNPIINGIENFIDGVGNLLGINDDESSPSASPSPSETATSPAAPAPTATEPAESAEPTTTAGPGGSTTPPSGATSAPRPSATDTEIPCLGARVYGKVASADDIPLVSQKPGVMKVDSLTMYNSTYDGVVDMPTTGGGSFKALKFSMDKAVNKPFQLTIQERSNGHTVITSDELTTTGTVKFYTPSFKGNLFGLIPVTFTPDSPPPLTLPILWFTNVEIQLAFVRCDVLTGDPLRVRETVG